ncbi:hypothetical protein M8C21_004972 [Ambrosia artemisiifolia]|uniref:Uncharacterized protein n=1 Tax=Ambrosia artemisiifolia TaxID=4212 RepID=A0AAD5D5Q7_AMBAR|nr:hypothetical protein M8C21_004972 [Ambrosia artemisiifolia]
MIFRYSHNPASYNPAATRMVTTSSENKLQWITIVASNHRTLFGSQTAGQSARRSR